MGPSDWRLRACLFRPDMKECKEMIPKLFAWEIDKGHQTEAEHRETYEMIRNYVEENKEMPPEEMVFASIAHDHHKEFHNYYRSLMEMEKNLEASK
jgi:hypothetical protein